MGKTTISHPYIGMITIPPVYGDLGDGLWHCFTHIPGLFLDLFILRVQACLGFSDWDDTFEDL